ncbi:MAG: helix-turn-helix transcriptional regulator [Oscillospiraceae bacterium]|nr:helix-turn-helix transcriptional regulator [Oscillospiraceae bacterium]
MDDEKLKKQIGANIASYRKRGSMTQVGLADRLNYSDKAVSKWERGESVPDVLTLVQMAKLFGVTVNDLLVDPDALPENPGRIERVMGRAVEKTLKRKADKPAILKLASVLVWFIALSLFVLLSLFDIENTWIAFVYAIPSDAIVQLCLRSAWKDFRWNRWLISVIMWGGLLSVFATVLAFVDMNLWSRLWRIFLLGVPGQAAILLSFKLVHKPVEEKNNG